MTSSTNTEKVVLYIDSKYRTSGTIENFTLTLANPIKKVIQVEVVSAEIPYTFYNITATNGQLVWSDSGATSYSVTVPPGNYAIATFTTDLQTLMNAQMPGFTVTYNSINFKLTFANAAAFQLDLTNGSGTSTLGPGIGLVTQMPPTPTTYAVSNSPSGVINISGPKYLIIKSSRLTLPKITRPFFNTTQDNILYKVAIAGSPGDILVEKNVYTNLMKYGVRQTISSIDFQLLDDQDNQIDLNFQDWSMTLTMVTG